MAMEILMTYNSRIGPQIITALIFGSAFFQRMNGFVHGLCRHARVA